MPREMEAAPPEEWWEEGMKLALAEGSSVITQGLKLILRARDIEPGAIGDMLLASAYYPAFRNEPLGGKRYIDGGVQDVLPVLPLIEAGCKDFSADAPAACRVLREALNA